MSHVFNEIPGVAILVLNHILKIEYSNFLRNDLRHCLIMVLDTVYGVYVCLSAHL